MEQRFVDNLNCAENCSKDCFIKIIGKEISLFHLVLESVQIKTKKLVLCRQKSSFSHLDSSINSIDLLAASHQLIGVLKHNTNLASLSSGAFGSASGYNSAVDRSHLFWSVPDVYTLKSVR